jgi:hypothetical protein
MDMSVPPLGPAPGFGTVTERRAAAERAVAEREEWRLNQLSSQAAPHKLPEERIKVWEQLHGLDLPRAPNHKLLALIAAQTRLDMREVLAEQLRRAEQVTP